MTLSQGTRQARFPPTTLTIAGSDCSGGAGIQADLVTFTRFGFRGATVVTAVTAQNSRELKTWEAVSPDLVRAQLEAVFEELVPVAVKIGMLGTREVATVVADVLERLDTKIVCDPVLAASAGGSLLQERAFDVLCARILPLADLVTPNRAEAKALSGIRVASWEDAEESARRILALGASAVLVTGGHFEGPRAVDLLVSASGVRRFEAARVPGAEVHGTGCTLSAAIAAGLGSGAKLEDAIRKAKRFVTQQIRDRFRASTGSA
jgi:hydroxymethylpyrimidine/phosphomethylpyrimidine kinase